MYTVSSPRITYSSEFRNSANPFKDKFGALTSAEWKDLWILTETNSNIRGIEFPTKPDQELQSQIHGAASWEISIREAFDFYNFIKSHVPSNDAQYFLDFGCGWGRITRPFMRDFDLNKMFGFEPNALHAIIARALNPYVTVFSGDFSPDGSIPKNWFDLIVGWSIFSHLSEASFKEWLQEIYSTLRPGGRAVFTTWGIRFLRRLQAEQTQLSAGKEIHWYSKQCLDAAGDINERIEEYQKGNFVWFTNTNSERYGEAFVSEKALLRIIGELGLGFELTTFDTSSLSQDLFILRRIER